MGIKMGVKKTVEVEAKTLKLHLKVRDCFNATLEDQDGNEIGSIDGDYVPDFMPGDHYGDYVILDIDIETGQVTNWEKPTAKELSAAFCKQDEDDDE